MALDEEIVHRVVNELSNQRSRNEIVRMVCEQGGVEWGEADQLVKTIEVEQGHTIASRRLPLLIFLSTGTTLIGALLFSSSMQTIRDLFGPDLGGLLENVALLIGGSSPVVSGVSGLAMMAGGAIGMWLALERYWQT